MHVVSLIGVCYRTKSPRPLSTRSACSDTGNWVHGDAGTEDRLRLQQARYSQTETHRTQRVSMKTIRCLTSIGKIIGLLWESREAHE
jgi:hypothetical protein